MNDGSAAKPTESSSRQAEDRPNGNGSEDSPLAATSSADGSLNPAVVEGAAVRFLQRVQISGPLPSASEMQAYQAIDGNLPGEILKDAAVRRDHRHGMEERAARTYASQVRLGQILAFVLAVVGFGAAIGAHYLTGSTVLAIFIAAFGVGAPITVALRGHPKEETDG